jgi:hypothetical protein
LGRHTRFGTMTGVDPSGCLPSLAIRSSASVADDAAKVLDGGSGGSVNAVGW